MGSVWRADRPQKGRFRQFTQCDIDILGDPTNLAEIELILATNNCVKQDLPGQCFTVRINDRGILFWNGTLPRIWRRGYGQRSRFTLDKMDKIGFEGVEKELLENGNAPESVSQL